MALFFNLAALKMYFKFSFLLIWYLCGPDNSKVIALWLCKMYTGSSVLKCNLCFSGDLMQQHASSPEGCPRKEGTPSVRCFHNYITFYCHNFYSRISQKSLNMSLDTQISPRKKKKKICHRVKCGKDEVRSSQPQSQSKTKNSSAEFIISVNLIMIVIVWGAFQCNNR